MRSRKFASASLCTVAAVRAAKACSQPITLRVVDLPENCTCLSDEVIDTIGRSGMFTQQQELRHRVSLTDDGVAMGVGMQSSEEHYAGRFPLALGETGTGSGDAGRRIHLVRAHCG
jgi:hypothetical protein